LANNVYQLNPCAQHIWCSWWPIFLYSICLYLESCWLDNLLFYLVELAFWLLFLQL